MNMIQNQNSDNKIKLGEFLTIQEVGELTNSIKTIFDSGIKVTIDASDVQRLDTAGVQLLCAIAKEAREKSISIVWESKSDTMRMAIKQLGLLELFE